MARCSIGVEAARLKIAEQGSRHGGCEKLCEVPKRCLGAKGQ